VSIENTGNVVLEDWHDEPRRAAMGIHRTARDRMIRWRRLGLNVSNPHVVSEEKLGVSVFLDGKERGMDKLLKKFLYCSCVGLLCAGVFSAPAYGQDTEIFIIEAGTDATAAGGGPTVVDVTGRLGEEIAFEIFINHIGPNPIPLLLGFQVDVPCEAEGGLSGSVDYVLGTARVNKFRDDWLFFQVDSVAGADESTCPEGNDPQPDGAIRLVGAAGTDGFPQDLNGAPPKYAGEFSMSVSADACGTFTFAMRTPDTVPDGGTSLADPDTAPIPAFFRDLIVAAAPLNDSCGTATAANSGDSFAYNTNCAGTDGPAGCPADADIWYSITTDCAGTLVADAGGGQVAIYSGSCTPTDAEEVDCAGGSASVSPVAPGQDYLIRLGSVGGGAISGTISIDCNPFCDTDADCTGFTDACNVGVCDPATGCVAQPTNEGGGCNDGVLCTIGDACSAGTCVGTPDALGPCADQFPCTIDSCDAALDECSNITVADTACDPAGGDDCELVANASCNPDTLLCECVDFICGPGTAQVCPGDQCTVTLCENVDPRTGIGFCNFTPPILRLVVEGASGPGCPAPVCVDPVGDTLIVRVEMEAAPEVSGAQVFLEYDAANFVIESIGPGGGPFVFELIENTDTPGIIDYAVGPFPGTTASASGDATVAVLRFRVLNPNAVCNNTGGIAFRDNNPPTRLAAPDGSSVDPALVDAGPIGINVAGAEILNCPFDDAEIVRVNGGCDSLTAGVVWDPLVATSPCEDDLAVACEALLFLACDPAGAACPVGGSCGLDLFCDIGVGRDDLADGGGEFPFGRTEIRCAAVDECGTEGTCNFDVINQNGISTVVVDVEVSPSFNSSQVERCFDFGVSECGDNRTCVDDTDCTFGESCVAGLCTLLRSWQVTLGGLFNLPGHGTAIIDNLPAGNWECVSAMDPLHTLRSTCLLVCEDNFQYVDPVTGQTRNLGSVFHASFKGSPEFNPSCHWLISGNVNGDSVIDILDYVTWSNNQSIGGSADTPCGTVGPSADFNGDGNTDIFDFAYILINFGENDKAGCDAACVGGAAATASVGPAARTEISVRELARMGYTAEEIRRADVTRDGVVDMEDMAAYMNGDGPQTRKRATSTRGTIGRR